MGAHRQARNRRCRRVSGGYRHNASTRSTIPSFSQDEQNPIPKFRIYEEEAAFWDNLDTADMMEDDGEWFHFDVADEQESGRDEKTILRRYRRRHDDDDPD